MWPRALLAVAVLSYLICVLLRGGQKDAENLSALHKFHGSNTTVKNVLNHESLYRNFRLNSSNEEALKLLLNSTAIEQIIEELHDVTNVTSRNITDEYKNNENNSTEPERTMTRGKRTAANNHQLNEHTTFLIDSNTNKDNVRYEDRKPLPNFKNVISFWKRFGKENDNTTDRPTNIDSSKLSNFLNKTNIEYYSKLLINNDLRDKDLIEAEYSRTLLPPSTPRAVQTTSQTNTSPASSDIITDDDTDIFKYILDSPDNASLEGHDINAHLNQYSYEINYAKIKYKNTKSNHKQDFLISSEKAKNTDHYGDFISDNSHHNIPVHEEIDIKYGKEKTIYLQSSRKPQVEMIYKDVATTSTLPPEIIKKIAEDVKALILKDLHKDLRKTTTATPAVTIAKGLADMIPKYNAGQNLAKPYPLTKILDILQKYKNGDNYRAQNSELKKAEAVRDTPKRPKHSNLYPYYLPIENKLVIKSENNSLYARPYKPYKSSQSKKISPVLKFTLLKPKPFVPIRDLPPPGQSVNAPSNLKSTPITLQTNMIEIPPLGVPVSHPLTFINNHIIISTRRPFKLKQRITPKVMVKIKNNNAAFRPKPVRTRNINTRINKNKAYPYTNKKRNQYEIDKKRMSSDGSREVKDVNPRDVYRVRTQNNIKKFHEKLEQYPRMKYKGGNMGDCCKDEIFTSEQRASGNMKSGDELSFKKLLQTQQKVTDMLTQMLARRKKEDLPLSVETT